MNSKLFTVSLLTCFSMLIWLIIQPSSLPFIAVRVIIALISIIFTFFAVTWNEKGGWKKTAIILLVVLSTGGLVLFAIEWGFKHYLTETVILLIVLGAISIVMINNQKAKIPAN